MPIDPITGIPILAGTQQNLAAGRDLVAVKANIRVVARGAP